MMIILWLSFTDSPSSSSVRSGAVSVLKLSVPVIHFIVLEFYGLVNCCFLNLFGISFKMTEKKVKFDFGLCGICLEPPVENSTPPCGHVFCFFMFAKLVRGEMVVPILPR